MLRIDHLVVNIDKKYQTDKTVIQSVRNTGFPYEPKWGKGTKGFKASNIWIGNEYLEMIHLLKNDGGGWKAEWVEKYNRGHRGLICLMLDVDDLDKIYEEMIDTNITKPQYLQFKWGLGLFTKAMPWRNSYFPFFEGVPLQIGLQQMKDEKSVKFMRQYMVPNSRDNGINGIEKIKIKGPFTESDFELINTIFKIKEPFNNGIIIYLDKNQKLIFEKANAYEVNVTTSSSNAKQSEVKIENILISN